MENQNLQTVYNAFLASTGVGIDSRKLQPGEIFFALEGQHFNGHDFIPQAIEKGVSMIVCSYWHYDVDFDSYCLVDHPLEMMQELAKWHVKQFKSPVLAITGSNGKTTNKELIAGLLSLKYKVHKTPGNFNNHIGLPLTILNAPRDCNFMVLEMGTNHFKEIEFLCHIGQPHYGMIINIGKSHLEFLGSEAGVLKAKAELADYLYEHKGILFCNRDETSIAPLLNHPVDKVVYGAVTDKVKIELVEENPYINLKIEHDGRSFIFPTRLIGHHHFKNLVNAIHLALYFGIELEEIKEFLSDFEPGENRSAMVEWRNNKVYLDAYNANPTSMWASLTAFDSAFPSPKAFIIGEMGELGSVAAEEHLSLMKRILEKGIDDVVFIGPQFVELEKNISYSGFIFFNSINDLLSSKESYQRFDGYHLFIKGSRSLKLERLLEG
ncbi:UDP-N-acetylmuramoyl-tripeptide--D-alanyl-D-alanine ligase [Membranihabitans marinus]|uniref:UDP-N-acetylmuramoyl-tripeptide--D-alanyl-D- alanine ligase n=1 Tax=Membranihabitans marinus TaxID=1227546 RepID=UPI001F263119|nr:UDP-N-acetylmuramoyl-tripeptide--D-alanyl-D-alanine ligase [Membranihabitans marinus]